MKSKAKRIITALCMVCLMLIDMKAANDSWYIWIITDNFVGIVIAFIMFTAYPVRDYLKPFYILWSVLGIAGEIGGYAYWYAHQAGHTMGFYITVPLNIWILGIVFFKYIEEIFILKRLKIHIEKWEYAFIACMLLMLISKSDYLWPLYFLVIFLMLWHLPFSQEDRSEIFYGVMDGIIAGFIVLQGKAFLFKGYGLVRYTGAYWNSNRNGALYLLVLTAFLVRILDADKKDAINPDSEKENRSGSKLKPKTVIYTVMSSVMAAFIMYTGSRTALVGMVIILITYVFIGKRGIVREKWGRIIGWGFIFLGVTAVAVPLLYYPICYLPLIRVAIRTEIKNIVKGTDEPVSISNENCVQLEEALDVMFLRFLRSDVQSDDSADDSVSDAENIILQSSDDNIETVSEEPAEEESSPYDFRIDEYDRAGFYTIEYYYRDYPERGPKVIYVPQFLYGGITSLNIRINFFAALISNMNLAGHDSSEVFLVLRSNAPGTSEDWINNEQNFIVHYLYAYGIPVGLFFCLLMLTELIWLIRSAMRGKIEAFAFAMFILVFVCIGMMELVWVPGQIVLILMFIAPLFFTPYDNCVLDDHKS